MKTSRTLLLVIAAIVAFSFSCSTMRTFVDWDRSADFSRYRTFAFRKGTPARNDITQRRIEDMITATLQAKGMTRVADERPDLRVFTHVILSRRQRIDYTTFGYGWRWGGGVTTATVSNIPVGTLIVDLVETGRREMVWRGRATDAIPADREERIEQLQTAVDKIFEGFPPGAATR